MRVLVTGGGGFLGKAIARRLKADGYEVRAFQRTPCPALAAEGVEVACGSITDKDALRAVMDGCEAVIHTAAKAGIWGPWETYASVNVEGTRGVIAAARLAGVRYLVHTSTPSVVNGPRQFEGEDESLPYGVRIPCAYAATKVEAERLALAAHEPGKLAVCALRPHLIWGPGDPHLVPRLLERARAGRLRIIGEGHNRVDLTHVENAAQAHLDALRALERGSAGGRAYFISDGAPVALWPWLNGVLELAGLPPLSRRVPLPVAYAAGAVCEALWSIMRRPGDPPMTRFAAHQLGTSHWFSIQRAQSELGYLPVQYDRSCLAELVRR